MCAAAACPQEWRAILKSMIRLYPFPSHTQSIRAGTGLSRARVAHVVPLLAMRGFIDPDPHDASGHTFHLLEAGMVVACGRALTRCNAGELVQALETALLAELSRCRTQRAASCAVPARKPA